MEYTELEKRFDVLTPEWIMSTNKLILDTIKWDVNVNFKGKIVRKGTYINGELKHLDCGVGKPDFIVLDKKSLECYEGMKKRAVDGLKTKNPFTIGFNTKVYIEVFGDYWHGGEYVQNLTKEEHEREVMEAYKNVDCELLILWQKEIKDNWIEICLPKIKKFLSECRIANDLPEWQDGKKIEAYSELDIDVYRSLKDCMYWRSLSDQKREMVADRLNAMYDNIDFPQPDKYVAGYDYRRFLHVVRNGSNKRTKFGNDCCKHYISSMFKAKVNGHEKLYDVWHNRELRKKSICWQFSNEDGVHNAERFLNAIQFQSGFRSISNLNPSKIVHWIRKHAEADEGSVFFDPCAGWGSRMLASKSLNMKYRAVDANGSLVKELNNMASSLKIDAEVVHGCASDIVNYEKVLKGEKIGLAFTSPPYFDKEIYSDDAFQSIAEFPDKDMWYEKFIIPMIKNVMNFMDKKGVFILNVDKEFDVDRVLSGIEYNVEDLDVLMEYSRGKYKERLIIIDKKKKTDDLENIDYVVCQVCHRRFSRILRHVLSDHGMSKEQYQNNFPDSLLICKKDSENVAHQNVLKTGKMNRKHRDKFKSKTEGIDYVICNICGFKGSSISRHVRREHGFIEYKGELNSQKAKENLHNGALLKWDRHGRKPKEERNTDSNITHKTINGMPLAEVITEELLKDLYEKQGLSTAMIGEKYGVTEVCISQYLDKYGIKANYGRVKNFNGRVLLSELSGEFGIESRRLCEILMEKGVAFEERGILRYFDRDTARSAIERCSPDATMISVDEISRLYPQKTQRQVRDNLLRTGIKPCLKFCRELYFKSAEVPVLVFKEKKPDSK